MADLQPPEELRMIAYRAAREWAAEHRHQQPDDRMVDVVLTALFEACTARERWLVKHLNRKGRSVWTRSCRDRAEAEQVEALNRDVAERFGDRSVLLRKVELSWTQPPPVVPDDGEKGAGDG